MENCIYISIFTQQNAVYYILQNVSFAFLVQLFQLKWDIDICLHQHNEQQCTTQTQEIATACFIFVNHTKNVFFSSIGIWYCHCYFSHSKQKIKLKVICVRNFNAFQKKSSSTGQCSTSLLAFACCKVSGMSSLATVR